MPKSKKTRKQKILSDFRKQQTPIVDPVVISEEKTTTTPSAKMQSRNPNQSRIAISTSAYSYLSHDLWKTFFLTVSIVVIEIALRYFIIK